MLNMKKMFVLAASLLLYASGFSQSTPKPALIPEPVSMTTGSGLFTLPQQVVIAADANPALTTTIDFLKQRLSVPTG